jgi:hypothetical protein
MRFLSDHFPHGMSGGLAVDDGQDCRDEGIISWSFLSTHLGCVYDVGGPRERIGHCCTLC